MTPAETALSRFAQGYNCAQSVLAAYAPQLGLEVDAALRLASGFGGGMGRMADTCGAVTGAFLVLGLKEGQASPEREAKEAIYARIREFAQRFKDRNAALACRDLLGCDISSPEGLQQARDTGVFTTICPKVVQDACEILDAMLNCAVAT